MLIFLCIILIIISALLILLGYAFLNNKYEGLIMWSMTEKVEHVTNKEGYKRLQGKYSILTGVIFLLVPVSLFFINLFHMNVKVLYLWFVVFAMIVISNAIQVRKYY